MPMIDSHSAIPPTLILGGTTEASRLAQAMADAGLPAILSVVLALGVLSPLLSWRLFRPILLTSAVGLIVLEAVMLTIHALSQDIGLAAVNAILLAITVPVLLGRRKA